MAKVTKPNRMEPMRKLTGPRAGGASPGSAQHLAARLAQARNKKSVKNLYGKALR